MKNNHKDKPDGIGHLIDAAFNQGNDRSVLKDALDAVHSLIGLSGDGLNVGINEDELLSRLDELEYHAEFARMSENEVMAWYRAIWKDD